MTDPVEVRRKLEEIFEDTLGKADSSAGIGFAYNDNGQRRFMMGVPYEITENDCLVIGPYLKESRQGIPPDYHSRKGEIPLKEILGFTRIDLHDLEVYF